MKNLQGKKEETKMLSFANDYSEGAHERILKRLSETNREQLTGYGEDHYCESAGKKICQACGCPEGQVYFLVGGTQTNAIVIGSLLKRYEGVISAVTGHVNAHEAGAIEYTGHKVLPLPEYQGKMRADDLENYLRKFYEDESHEHMVFPGMVYISHPTEYGTLYSRKELEEICGICRKYEMPLYLDGARLGYGLMSRQTDVTLQDIAGYCDVFYIGGTKVGALCGEAVVFPAGNAPKYFMTMVKQQGGMLAKGRLLGIQFDELFTDDLYLQLGRQGIETAERMKEIFRELDYKFYLESPTNQQFLLLEDSEAEALRKKVNFSFWEKPDANHTAVRFATSWATTGEMLEKLGDILRNIKNDKK